LQDAVEVPVPQNIVHYRPNDTVSHLQKPESLSLTCLIQPHCVIVSTDICLKEDFKISVMLSNTLQIQLSVTFDNHCKRCAPRRVIPTTQQCAWRQKVLQLYLGIFNRQNL